SISLKAEHPPWPGDPLFSRQIISSIAAGDSCNVSCLQMSSHFGTHIDAPYHFEEDGVRVDEIPLETLMGKALVHEVDAYPLIQPEHLPDLTGVERILFKTSNCWFIDETEFHTDYVSLGVEAARILVQAGITLVGLDYFSIEAFKAPGHPVHHALCGGGVILLEGVDLRQVPSGWYELLALPLKIEGADGSPCRAVLRDLKE
ncbi:MAG: cyclase family protein, partial [Candidatus Hinthialibacter sp.]